MLTGSMTGAGRLLSVSQPAVTRLIRELEADLKLTLFRREGTHLSPTREGNELYREVKRYFIGTERIREAATAIREYSTGQLRIATILTLAHSCVPSAISSFATKYPGIVVSVHSGASLDIIDLVINGRVDVGLVAIPAGRTDLDQEPMPEAEVVCILPREHALARRKQLTAKDLHGQDFIALGPTSLMRMELNAILNRAGSVPRIRVESLFSSTVAAYVNRGTGIAVVDPLAAGQIDPKKVAIRPFRPRIKYSLAVVYPPHTDRAPPVRDFVDIFLAAYSDELAATRKLMSQ